MPSSGSHTWPVYWNRPEWPSAGNAVFVIGVDVGDRAAIVGERDDRALVVGEQIARRGEAGAFVGDHRNVGAHAVDVAAQQLAGSAIFGDERIAIVEEGGGGRAIDQY